MIAVFIFSHAPGRSKTNVKHNLNTTGCEILCDRKRSSRPWLLLPHAVFRLERFTEVTEFTYLGKHFPYVNANWYCGKCRKRNLTKVKVVITVWSAWLQLVTKVKMTDICSCGGVIFHFPLVLSSWQITEKSENDCNDLPTGNNPSGKRRHCIFHFQYY